MAITAGNTSSSSTATNGTVVNVAHNSNGTYLIGFYIGLATAETARTVTATYNSTAMTELITETTTTTTRRYVVYIFGLDSPTSGSNTLEFTASATMSGAVWGGLSISGQNATPKGNTATNTAGCTTSLTAGTANSILLTASCVRSNTTPPTITMEADQTEVFNLAAASANTEPVGAAFYRIITTATSYTLGGTTADTTGDIACSVEIKEATTAAVKHFLASSGVGR